MGQIVPIVPSGLSFTLPKQLKELNNRSFENERELKFGGGGTATDQNLTYSTPY
jgi:hypothetical protein